MSRERSQAATQNAVEWPAQFKGSKRRFFRDRSVIRWVALLYSLYFLIEPARGHSIAVWTKFAILYAAFLILYFLVAELEGRGQIAAFVLFFLIAFLYYGLSAEAYGVFAYPFAMLCLNLSRLRSLLLVLAAMMAGVTAETHYLGRSLSAVDNILLLCVIFGLGNFAFAQLARTNSLLQRANAEIERLSQAAERERIARDLHDLLGHTLTAIAVKLNLARRLLSSETPHDIGRARSEVVEAEQTARNALAEVREAVSGYRAAGLEAEISRARRSLLSGDVELTTALAPVNLSSRQANVLCLALREAVTNIVRHAHAKACRVTLMASDGAVHFTIADNGTGGPISEGNGLRGMRERVEAMGGAVKLSGAADGGTSLELMLPLENEPAHAASPLPGEAEPL